MKTYLSIAKKRWGKAEWIEGEGPFALLAHCRVLTVTLWETYERALKEKNLIDQIGCGGACNNKHEIIQLKDQPMSNPEDYGNYFYVVSKNDEDTYYVFADVVEITPNGDLLLIHIRKDGSRGINLALAKNNWSKVTAASCIDGRDVAITVPEDCQ